MIETVNIFKYHRDLSCEYIEMEFRIYLLDSNISCIYSAIKFQIWSAYICRLKQIE